MADPSFCDLNHKNSSCILYPVKSAEGKEHLTPTELAWLAYLQSGLDHLEKEVRQRRGMTERGVVYASP